MEPQQKSEKANKRAALTIVFESWSIPIIGLTMFLIGMFAGYNLRQGDSSQNTISAAATQSIQQPPAQLGRSNEEVMDYVLTQVRHFQGDPEAPVTLIEFGDFQ